MVVPTRTATPSNQYLANSVPDLSSYECCSTGGCSQMSSKLRRASLTRFARDVYSPLLQNTVVKVMNLDFSLNSDELWGDEWLRGNNNVLFELVIDEITSLSRRWVLGIFIFLQLCTVNQWFKSVKCLSVLSCVFRRVTIIWTLFCRWLSSTSWVGFPPGASRRKITYLCCLC